MKLDVWCRVCGAWRTYTFNRTDPAAVLRRLRALGWTAESAQNLICPKCTKETTDRADETDDEGHEAASAASLFPGEEDG